VCAHCQTTADVTPPSEHVHAQIKQLADFYEEYYAVLDGDREYLIDSITKIVDEAVREAILITAKVVKE
jgi:poly-beta-hydroxyalkanoate depolymerase